jgi:hypothetical protein
MCNVIIYITLALAMQIYMDCQWPATLNTTHSSQLACIEICLTQRTNTTAQIHKKQNNPLVTNDDGDDRNDGDDAEQKLRPKTRDM